MGLDQSREESWTVIFRVIGGIVFLLGILGFFLIQEKPSEKAEPVRYAAALIYGFRPSVIKQNSELYVTLLAYAVFGISIQIFMPYLILYYTVTLGMENYVLLFAPAIILAAAFTFFYGKVYDRRGFTFSVVPALILLMAGYVLLYFFAGTVIVFLGTLIMLCGYLAGMAVFGAMLRDRTPEGKAGMFQGQRIIGQVLIPGIIGPSIGAFVLRNADTVTNSDGTVSFVPDRMIFLAAFIAAALIWGALIPVFRRKGTDGK